MFGVFYAARKRAIGLVALLLTLAGEPVASAQEEFEGWNLEPGLAQAHLVMVAKVTSVGNLTIVEGAKTDVALREYRFQPVKRLKGLFQRDQLSMTGSDLGLPPENGSNPPPLKEGEHRLLILTQQQGRYAGCVSAAPGATTFGERVPSISGPDDPLVGVVETLIQVIDSRSRRERAHLLIEKLGMANGRTAIPLLSSLMLRADWATGDRRVLTSLARLARDPAPVVQAAALDSLRAVLANGGVVDKIPPDELAEALRETLTADGSTTRLRLAALESLGHLLAIKTNLPWARDLLATQLTGARTYSERAAVAAALSHLGQPATTTAILDALAKAPLDEQPARVAVLAKAAVRLDPAATEKVLLTRLQAALAARHSADAEVEALGKMRSKDSLPLLLNASTQGDDGARIAWALGRLSNDRAVPVLAEWLRSNNYQLKEPALTALEALDTAMAAREVRPSLKSEPHLTYKLRIARLLARHGITDGYALATEHLADPAHTAEAALVLAALKDARTVKDLNAILAAKPDRRWHAAALTGLVAVGDAAAKEQLRAILADERHPLAADAAEAVGLAGDPELLAPLANLVKSRNRQITKASLVALRRYFSGVHSSPRGLLADADDAPVITSPAATKAILASTVAAVALDPYIDADLRHEAFAVAVLLKGDGLPKLLADLADQAELEGTPLLMLVLGERTGNSPAAIRARAPRPKS